MNRDELARQVLGHFDIKTASDIRDTRNPARSRVLTWVYANSQAMLVVSDGSPLPSFPEVEYLNAYCILLKFSGQAHKLTAPPIVPNAIIDFPNAMAIGGPKKYLKAVSLFIRQSGSRI